MTYLAKVARADAIAVILQMKGEGYVTYVAHNLPTDTRWSEGLPSVMLAKAMSERATDQATSGVTLTLSDGRAADTLAVSPVIWKDQVVGGLAAVLAGRAFSAEDLSSLSRVGDLIGLELAEANALWRAQRQGQDAEAKLKASRDLQAIIRKERDPDQLLERATAQLADVFGADGVSIMLADAHGELSVRSSRGLSDVAKLDRKRIGEGISGTVAQTGRSMLLSGQVQGGSDPTASSRRPAAGAWAAEEHPPPLRAPTGPGAATPADISTAATDTVLAQALRERRTATAQSGIAEDRPDWAAPSSTHFLLAPIGG